MTNTEIEHLISKQYSPRKRRLRNALSDGAIRTPNPVESHGDRCAICTRAEHGGGLFTYQSRDGSEMLLGERCAGFLDYLIANPNESQLLLT